MKRKVTLLILTLVLALSAAAFVGCKKDGDDGAHKHVYVKVEAKAPTCKEVGRGEYYKCSDCDLIFTKNGDEYAETTLAKLELPKVAHNFTGITVTSSKDSYTAFEEVNIADLTVTKTCSYGCSGEVVSASEIKVTYPNGANKLTANVTSVTVSAGGFTKELSVTVNKIGVDLPEIEPKAWTGEKLTADITVSEDAPYTLTKNEGGKDPGDYDVVLTLKDGENYEFNEAEGAVIEGAKATVKFTVLNKPNTVTISGEIAGISCYGTPDITANALDGAAISFVYCDKIDGEYSPIENFGDGLSAEIATTWYVKAVAAETDNYSEGISEPKSFTVTHGLGGYIAGEGADKPKCACGTELEGGEAFITVVSEPQYVLASSATAFATDLAKLTFGDSNAKIDSSKASTFTFKCGDLELGSATAPNAVNVATLIGGAHGEKSFIVTVTDKNGYTHDMTVSVILVTEVITDRATLLHNVQYHSGNTGTIFGAGKYYVLGNNIEIGSTSKHEFDGTEYTVDYTWTWGDNTPGFAGTLDGRGYSLTGIEAKGYSGLFGSINGATVKNIVIMANSFEYTVFSHMTRNVTINNTVVILTSPIDTTNNDYSGIFGVNQISGKFTDVTVHGAGSNLYYVLSKGSHAIDETEYKNCNVYLQSYKFAALSNDFPSTIKFKETKVHTNYATTLETATKLTFPGYEEEGYKVTNVTINGTKISDSATLSVSDISTAVSGAFGAHTATVTLKNDKHEFSISTEIVYATRAITTWEELRYYVGWRSGCGDEYRKGEYYVLANDIVGGNTNTSFDYDGTTYAHSETSYADYKNPIAHTDYKLSVGFAGTLNGAGHTVSGMTFGAYSLFGTLNGGTIKNINLEGKWTSYSYGVFAGSGHMYGATIENVTITFSEGSSVPSESGVFAGDHMGNCTIKNVTVHAEGLELKYIFSKAASPAQTSGLGANTYSGNKVYAKNYTYGAANNGLVLWHNYGYLRFYMDKQTVELAGDTVSVALPTGWKNSEPSDTQYSFYDVAVNGKSISGTVIEGNKCQFNEGGDYYSAIDFAKLNTKDILTAIGNTSGDYEITFKTTKNGWNYAYGGYSITVHFEVPAATEPSEPSEPSTPSDSTVTE